MSQRVVDLWSYRREVSQKGRRQRLLASLIEALSAYAPDEQESALRALGWVRADCKEEDGR